ncbi:MAG: putative ankyrin repeat protein [Satyrvirus sp.]|uniref:Putative ankyrin repeat protein n=1 Tax=Satyrvirus sp. TaxID=2487771 RepID=A0A3G5AEL8_9VIRU|nr:MAG: putative ankyrin repeat protein [Satyrvirus sp.]
MYNEIYSLIENDDLDKFQKIVSKNTLNDEAIFCYCVDYGATKILEWMFQNGVEVSCFDNFAICNAPNSAVLDLLAKYGADPCHNNNEPIINAVIFYRLGVVKSLVEHGADVAARNNMPLTKLCEIFKGGATDIADYLLKNGANPSVSSGYPLKKSITNGNFGLSKVLIKYGANVSDLGMEDLLYVVNNGSPETVQLLADSGIDFSLLNGYMPEYINKLLVQKLEFLSNKGVDFKNLYAIMLSKNS